jgi:hypothetical protein
MRTVGQKEGRARHLGNISSSRSYNSRWTHNGQTLMQMLDKLGRLNLNLEYTTLRMLMGFSQR